MKYSLKKILFCSVLILPFGMVLSDTPAFASVSSLKQRFETGQANNATTSLPLSKLRTTSGKANDQQLKTLAEIRDRHPKGSELYNLYDKRIKALHPQSSAQALDARKKIEEIDDKISGLFKTEVAHADEIKRKIKKPEYQEALLKQSQDATTNLVSGYRKLKAFHQKKLQGQAIDEQALSSAQAKIDDLKAKLDLVKAKVNYLADSAGFDTQYAEGQKYLKESEQDFNNALDSLKQREISMPDEEISHYKTLHEGILEDMKGVMKNRKDLVKAKDMLILSTNDSFAKDKLKDIFDQEDHLKKEMESLDQERKELYDTVDHRSTQNNQ